MPKSVIVEAAGAAGKGSQIGLYIAAATVGTGVASTIINSIPAATSLTKAGVGTLIAATAGAGFKAIRSI